MNASLAPLVPPPGRIGFFCQSGALGIAILADAAARGLGLSTFVSAGNRVDVSGNDLLSSGTATMRPTWCCCDLESFGNPRKFARLAQRSSAPLTGEQRSIFIQQGPELDQLVNVKRGRLHAPQSFPRAHNHSTLPALGQVTAPLLPAPQLRWDRTPGAARRHPADQTSPTHVG